MYFSSSFSTYQSSECSSSSFRFFHNNLRYLTMLIFFVFKILEWKFDKVTQEQIRLNQISSYKKHSLIKKTFSPKRSRKNSFKKKENAIYEEVAKTEKDICNICKNKLWDPVAIKSSLYVYCKQCIMDYINVNKMCPQTGIKLTNPKLIKIYI